MNAFQAAAWFAMGLALGLCAARPWATAISSRTTPSYAYAVCSAVATSPPAPSSTASDDGPDPFPQVPRAVIEATKPR